MAHLMYRISSIRFRLLSGHLLGKSCSLVCPYVLFVFCTSVILGNSRFGFEGMVWVLIVRFGLLSGHLLGKSCSIA